MPDIKITNTGERVTYDFAIQNMDLALDAGLETAVLISIFSDRRVTLEKLPDGETDQHGWWGDEFLETAGDQIGSELWTLARAKRTVATLTQAKQFILEALQWMIDDGVASSIGADVQWNPDGTLAGQIAIQRPNARDVNFKFTANWNAELGLVG